MKKLVKTTAIAILISALALLSACSNNQSTQTTTVPESTTEVTTQAEISSEQEVNQATFSTYTTWLGDVSLDIEDGYQFVEKYEDNAFKTELFSNDNGSDLRIISEENVTYIIDETTFKEELTVTDEIHVVRTEILDIENFGVVYGALLDDHQLNVDIFYYKFANGDNMYSVMFIGNPEISEYDESKIKQMITSLKKQ